MSEKVKLTVILGSVRIGRFGQWPAKMIKEVAEKISDFEVSFIDLKEENLPNFESAVSPAYITNQDYGNEKINSFADKIRESDAFIMISPEYNHGYSSAIKNAIDSIYIEWNKKPVGFLSYGSAGGARAVEQLREVAVELQMAPIRNGVHIMSPWNLVDENGNLKDGALTEYESSMQNMLDQLLWWANALKIARNS
jgi:NAD(P)H-dependent FMN reductase